MESINKDTARIHQPLDEAMSATTVKLHDIALVLIYKRLTSMSIASGHQFSTVEKVPVKIAALLAFLNLQCVASGIHNTFINFTYQGGSV